MARFSPDQDFESQPPSELETVGHGVATPASLHIRGAQDCTIIARAADGGRIVSPHTTDDDVLLVCLWRLVAVRWNIPTLLALCPGGLALAQFMSACARHASLIDARTRYTMLAGEVQDSGHSGRWTMRDCRPYSPLDQRGIW